MAKKKGATEQALAGASVGDVLEGGAETPATDSESSGTASAAARESDATVTDAPSGNDVKSDELAASSETTVKPDESMTDQKEAELLSEACRRYQVIANVNSRMTLAGIVSRFRHDPDLLDEFELGRNPQETAEYAALRDHLHAKNLAARRQLESN